MIIICLSPGRTGTKKLAQLLATVPGVFSEHEGKPFAQVMRRNQYNPSVGLEFVKQKLASYKPIHADIDHVTIEGFVEHYLELGVVPNAVEMHRPPREVASSHYQLSNAPHLDGSQAKWLIHPRDPGNKYSYPNWHSAHDYQLCYWYALEIRERQYKYSQMLLDAGANVWSTDVHSLLDVSHFNRMLTCFGLPNVASVNQSVVHARTTKGPLLPLPDNLDELEAQVLAEIK